MSHDATNSESAHCAIVGPNQLVKIDDGVSVHVRTAKEWLDLARADLSARSETAPLVAGDLAKQREIHDSYAPSAIEPRHIAGRQREADARFLYKQAEEGDMIFKQTATYLADLVSKNTLVESK